MHQSISEKVCYQVSCSPKACDWTTGRKRSHSNSNQLTDKYVVVRKIENVVVSSSRGLLLKPELQDVQLGVVMQA